MRYYFLLAFFFLTAFLKAQTQELLLQINPTIDQFKLEKDKTYFLNQKESFTLSKLKFYLSHLELLKDGQVVFKEKESYHLIDIENANSQFLSLDFSENIEYDSISFFIGIDSITHEKGALNGDLDPTKGMYWTWQSGYVNIKLEGVITSNSNLVLHLGGYVKANRTIQKITLPIHNLKEINVSFDLKSFLLEVLDTSNYTIMSPGKEAVYWSSKFAKLFVINPE